MTKLSSRQVVLIGALFAFTDATMSVQAQLASFARQHLCMVYFITFAVLLIPLWMLARVSKRFPRQDLFQALAERHPVMGRTVVALYILYFLWVAARDVRLTGEFFNITLLARTPVGVIAAVNILAAVTLVRPTGINVLARSSELYGTALFLIIPLVFIALFKDLDFSYMLPLTDVDWVGVLEGAWVITAYFGDMIGIAFLVSGGAFRFRDGMLALALASFGLMVISMLALLSLSVPVMSAMTFPLYEMVRQIRITDFLDRFELPVLAVWATTIVCKIGYSLYLISLGFKRIIPGLPGQRVVFPAALLIYSCSFWFFENAVDMINMNLTMPLAELVFQFLLPAVLFFALWPKREGGGENRG